MFICSKYLTQFESDELSGAGGLFGLLLLPLELGEVRAEHHLRHLALLRVDLLLEVARPLGEKHEVLEVVGARNVNFGFLGVLYAERRKSRAAVRAVRVVRGAKEHDLDFVDAWLKILEWAGQEIANQFWASVGGRLDELEVGAARLAEREADIGSTVGIGNEPEGLTYVERKTKELRPQVSGSRVCASLQDEVDALLK